MTMSRTHHRLKNIAPVVACLGVSWWKHQRIRSFLQHEQRILFFCSTKRSLEYAYKKNGSLAIWANQFTPELQKAAHTLNVPLLLIEDGFIRSIGLGSGFLPPCSIIVDQQNAYVDPSQPSDLEDLLSHADVSSQLRERTHNLIATLQQLHISKYGSSMEDTPPITCPKDKPIILVPGQVAGDLSVVKGGGAITNNLSLLQAVRKKNPESWIIYRPHPDVEAGYRKGAIADHIVRQYANLIHRGGNMSKLLDQIDEVHTLTSLTGFEALLRGKKVTTYGAPFYAGWGLTHHLGPPTPRRKRKLDLINLAAISLILYPLYLDPESETLCEVEDLISSFEHSHLWKPTLIMKLRHKQGQFCRYISRLVTLRTTPDS